MISVPFIDLILGPVSHTTIGLESRSAVLTEETQMFRATLASAQLTSHLAPC